METIQKATDEEYQEALEREASRSLVEIEPGFLDSEPDNSRNSVTILLSPREDFFDTDDTMPEASHVHETRCIHTPLGRSSSSNNDLGPRMSKQKLYLKQKPLRISSKSLFDMDNSASNVKETFAVNNNDLSTKLRINPLLLNNLPIKTVNDPISKTNSGYELRKIIPERSNVLKNNELDSPKLRLAALKSRLRDLVEMRNINRMNNIPVPSRQNNLDIFRNKGETGKLLPFDTNSPLDPLFDNASPALKNILKLKDVELLPPNELFRKHPSDKKLKLSDLNVAASENNVKISDINEDAIDTRKNNNSEEKVQKEPTEQEEKSTKNASVKSDEIHCSEKENSKDVLIEEMQRRLDDCLKSARRAHDEANKNTDTDLKDTKDSFEYDSKEADDESDIEDSIAETSDNINEQISHEEGDSITDKEDSLSLLQSTDGSNDEHDSLTEPGNDGIATFKNDILRKLENIKKSIKSKLQDTDPKMYLPVNEKGSTNKELSNFDLNPEGDQNKDVTIIPQLTNEKDVTIQDLQNLSDSLLQQENKLKAKTISIEDETNFKDNENQDYEPANDLTNEDKSASSELDPTETEENQTSEDDDPISNETNFNNYKENNDPESSKYTYDKIDNDNDDLNSDTTLPKDSETNEMSSQASNSKYNAIVAPLSDKLISPTLQDTFSLFKTPIQIPSLEEIRQGISEIIDAGQKESEDFQTEFDPLNESSNRNSVLSNPLQWSLPKSNYLGKPLTDRYLRPFQITRYNDGGNKNLLDTASLNPLITEPFGYPSTLSSYPLASDRSNKIIKASDATNIPSLDDITRFFQSQNHLKSPNSNLPKTNLLKTPHKINSLADDLKYRSDTKPEFKQAKPRLEANDFLQSMTRKHEDVKEKLQALHLDFNDRLASMYKRLNEQKLQSVNNPTFKAKNNKLALPKSASKKEKFNPNLNSNKLAKLDNNFLSQPQTLQDTFMKKKPTPKSNSISSKNFLRNYNIKPKTSTVPLIEREHFYKNPNLSERHKIAINKQKTFKPISKVKISFTTPKPLLASGLKLPKENPIKMPSRLSEKDRTANINNNLKDISKALRSGFQPLGDLNHAPSELIETKQLNEDSTNSQFGPMSVNNRPRLNNKQADSEIAPLKETQEISTNSIPKKTESPIISNLREALKARLQNITNTHTKMSKNPVKSTNLREDDAMVSPSIVKTSVLNNPLIENTSYKCTMICSKDS